MKPSLLIPVLLLAGVAAGLLLAPLSRPQTSVENLVSTPALPTDQPPPSAPIPTFAFDQPFDPRAAFEQSLRQESPARRIGLWMAIGAETARQSDPLDALAALEPDVWDYPYYDLRGCFFAEFMRRDPDAFIPWAEAKYQELSDSGALKSFPSYHLSYLEPERLLDLLPRFAHPKLVGSLKSLIVDALVEKNPELLWTRRSELAPLPELLDAAAGKGLWSIALDFWERAGFPEDSIPYDMIEYIGETGRTDLFPHLSDFGQTSFATAFAAARPEEAAAWVRHCRSLPDIAYEFDDTHGPFFRALFQRPDFPDWNDAPLWLAEACRSDWEGELAPLILRALVRSPQRLDSFALQESLSSYLSSRDPETLGPTYLKLPRDHPLLPLLEAALLAQPERFGDLLAERAAAQDPSPRSVLAAIHYGSPDAWPPDLQRSARQALDALSDSQLQWELRPDTLLNAYRLAPERIADLLESAPPEWVATTLASNAFLSSANAASYPILAELLNRLPPEEAAAARHRARASALHRIDWDGSRLPEIAFAESPPEAFLISYSIRPETWSEDPRLRAAIETHPQRETFLYALAQRQDFASRQEPALQQARQRLERSRQLLYQDPATLVSTFQSLPPAERESLLVATVFNAQRLRASESLGLLLQQPFWSESEKQAIKARFLPDERSNPLPMPFFEPLHDW